MQEVKVSLYKDEEKTSVERPQNYGFTSRPLKPSKDDKGKMRKAEALVVFIGGNRSHAMVAALDDRRHRFRGKDKKGIKEGESAQYDDQGQYIHVTREGIRVFGSDKKLPVEVEVGTAKLTVKDGEILCVVGSSSYSIKPGQILADVGGMKFSIKPSRIDMVKVPATIKMLTEAGPSEVIWGELTK